MSVWRNYVSSLESARGGLMRDRSESARGGLRAGNFESARGGLRAGNFESARGDFHAAPRMNTCASREFCSRWGASLA